MTDPAARSVSARSDLWVITAYFNLARWSSRLQNYRAFRRALSVPLAAIEWHPAGSFDLTSGDADLLLQRDGGDLMWQKERLLGIVLAALPEHVRYVAWVDCDVIFADPHWHERTRWLLEASAVVQPFRRVVYLHHEPTQRIVRFGDRLSEVLHGAPEPTGGSAGYPGGDRGAHPSRPSFLDLFERVGDEIAHVDLARRFEPEAGGAGRYDVMARPAYGHAWAARVDVLRGFGFYERCVVGGADLLSAYGMVGQYEAMMANHRSVGWEFYGGGPSYREWARHAGDLCRGQLRCGDETIVHLHHGSLENRQYRSRIDGLVRFGLDIERDIAAGPGAPWSWTRNATELNSYFLEYLRNRQEDA